MNDPNLHDPCGFNKGKFISAKNYNARKARSEGRKRKWEEFREAKRVERELNPSPESEPEEEDVDSGNIKDTKRRLVELKQLAADLICTSCKNPLTLQDYVEERQYGLAFEMIVKCRFCGMNSKVCTGKKSKINPSLYAMNCKIATGKSLSLESPGLSKLR